MSARVEVHGHTVSPEHYIDGARVGSPTTFEDRSPIDGSLLANVCRGDAATADAAISAAVRAFPAWSALGPEGRAPYLHRLAELIDAHVDHIAEVECWDMAMLERSLKARVIGRGARNFRAYADLSCEYEERLVAVEWDDEPRRAQSERPGRRDYPVERTIHALDVEDRSRAGGRLHRRAQAR